MNVPVQDMVCPFCKEGDFDGVGLALHLEHRDCAEYFQMVNSPEFNKYYNRAIKHSGVAANPVLNACEKEPEHIEPENPWPRK